MRRVFCLLILCSAFLPLTSPAQDRTAEAAARAAREESEERYRLLNGKIESLTETQELLLRKHDKLAQQIANLLSEVEQLKRSHTQSSANAVTRDQLKEVLEKVQEVDRKRLADQKTVLEGFKELKKLPPPVMPSVPEVKTPPPGTEDISGAYEYVVQKGDSLDLIIAAYNKEYKAQGQKTITRAQVLALNPTLKPERLISGKKILIPKPPEKK